MPKRVQSSVLWLLGFFLLANVYLLPGIVEFRATDALGIVLGLWLLWRFFTRGLSVIPFVFLFAFSMIPLFWGLLAFFAGDGTTITYSVRWLLAAAYGGTLFILAQDLRHRTSLAWGLWWGCVGNIFVLLLHFYDFVQLTQSIGLAAQTTALTNIYELNNIARAPGMHYHPNASAAIVSLVVPLSLYLYYTRRAGIWIILVGLSVLVAGTEFTLSRSPILVSLATILVVTLTNKKLASSLRVLSLLTLGGLVTLYWVGPPGGWQRWAEPGDIRANGGGRIQSTLEGLRISIEHPWGTGNDIGQEALRRAGVVATHDAFVQVAIVYGLLFAVALASLILLLALQPLVSSRTTWRLESALACQLFVLFLWEEHLNSASFIVLASWLLTTSIA